MHKLKWPLVLFLRYYRHLGLRIALYALLSLAVALISPLIESFLSDETARILEFGSVIPVLTILASSMLAVSTFSLNVMVSAHRAAATTTTPRVHRLLLEDTTTQSVLAVFIGAFVYSLSSIVLYQAGFYSDGAAIVVMAVTIFVVFMIILAMLRWIDHLSNLGSVDDSIRKVVARAADTLTTFAQSPALGANPLTGNTVLPEETTELRAPDSGYLQLIDVNGLERDLPEHAFIYVTRSPGTHVLAGEVVALISGDADKAAHNELLKSLVFGDQRTFEQDAAFGLSVLSEIASKALSPGINDSGTAIQTVLHLKSLIHDFSNAPRNDTPVDAPKVFVPVPGYQSLLDAAFLQVSRDGAGKIEVAMCLRRALRDLATSDDPDLRKAALVSADRAMEYARAAGLSETELDHLGAVKTETAGY